MDAALNLGFQNHETFTRAFKAAFGIAPEDYRNGKRIKSEFDIVLVPDVSLMYTLIDEDVPLISDGIILEISRRTFGEERIYGGFKTKEENPGSAWCLYKYLKAKNMPFLHPRGDHAGIGMETESGYSYLSGYRVTQRDTRFVSEQGCLNIKGVPDYLSNNYSVLPPGEYLVCTFTAETFDRLVVEAMFRVIYYFHKKTRIGNVRPVD